MGENFISRQIGRCNRNLLIVNLLVLAGLAGLAYANRSYLSACLRGPYSMNAAQLAAPHLHSFARVSGEKAYDSGYSYDRGSGATTGHFLALKIGSRLLLVKAKDLDLSRLSYTGTLVSIPDNVEFSILDPLRQKSPRIAALFLPLMLDATASFRESAIIALLFCLPLALLCLWNLKKAVARQAHPETHPLARRLARYGGLEDVAHAIEQESQEGMEKFGGARLTRNWVLRPGLFGFEAARIPDLVWIYKKVTTQKLNGIIPISKSYAARLLDRYGRSVEIQARKKKVEALLQILHGRVPWAVFGYSDQLKTTAKTSFNTLAAAVAQRRQEMEKATGQAAAR